MTPTDHASQDAEAVSPDRILPAALTALPGLDLASGLSVVRGNAARYLELLQRFIADHTSDMQRIDQLLAEGDRAGATRLAHSIKGTAATLGALDMSENARQLEMTLRASPDAPPDPAVLQAAMDNLQREFIRLAAALPPLAAKPAATEAPPLDPARLKDILDTLDARLAEGDLAASALFDEHAALLASALGPDCRKIAAAIRQYDFKAALDALRALRATIATP